MSPAVLFAWILLGYVAIGVVLAIPMVLVGLGRIDPVMRQASLRVRLLFAPGCALLWPLLLAKWCGGTGKPASGATAEQGAADGS